MAEAQPRQEHLGVISQEEMLRCSSCASAVPRCHAPAAAGPKLAASNFTGEPVLVEHASERDTTLLMDVVIGEIILLSALMARPRASATVAYLNPPS